MLESIGALYGQIVVGAGLVFMAVLGAVSVQDGLQRRRTRR